MAGEQMAKEIAEQPRVLARLLSRWREDIEHVRGICPRRLAGVMFLARGSSDNAAVCGRYLAELYGQRPAGLVAPSLYSRYGCSTDYSGYLVVALSQSGRTSEIVSTCSSLRKLGARTIAITNDPDSPLANVADLVLDIAAGMELAIPATKTVTAEMLEVALIAEALGEGGAVVGSSPDLVGVVETVLGNVDSVSGVVERWGESPELMVTGRGIVYAAVLEAALKVKESSGVSAQGLSIADLLHGPIAAIKEGMPALVIKGGVATIRDVDEILGRLRDLRASIAVCGTVPDADLCLPRGVSDVSATIGATVYGQLLALVWGRWRGLDPDAPAGLKKVTST